MRKPGARTARLLIVLLAIVTSYGVVEYVVPHRLRWLAQSIVGDRLTFERISLRRPDQLVLTNAQLRHAPTETPVLIPRMVVRPARVSWPERVVSARRIDVEGLRMTVRRRPDGRLEPALGAVLVRSDERRAAAAGGQPLDAWRMTADTLHIGHGLAEFVDEKLTPPFRARCDALTISAGPVSVPADGSLVSVAIQGRIVAGEHDASVYCSGWFNVGKADLDVACRLEPIRLSAFEPYYQGEIQIRAYDAMLAATAQCTAKANAFEARIQLQVDHLDEADLSYGSRTILDIKRIAQGEPHVLSGELKLTGPLDRPGQWDVRFLPGNAVTQRLAEFFDRPLEQVTVTVGGETIQLDVTQADATARSDIESASRSVQRHLKILAPETGGIDLSPTVAPAVPSPVPQPSAAEPPSPPDGSALDDAAEPAPDP